MGFHAPKCANCGRSTAGMDDVRREGNDSYCSPSCYLQRSPTNFRAGSTTDNRPRNWLRPFGWTVGAFVALVVVLVVVGAVIGRPASGTSQGAGKAAGPKPKRVVSYLVPSASMEPTIRCASPGVGCTAAKDDHVVVEEPSPTPTANDLVIVQPSSRATDQCGLSGPTAKRVVAVPGQTWAEKDGYVYIDGKPLHEPYVSPSDRDSETFATQTIRPGHYFLMGDNRKGSCDSRVYGPAARRDIVGKIIRIQRSG